MDLLINFPLGMNIKRQFHHRLADPVGTSEWDAYFGTTTWRDAEKRPEGLGVALLELYKSQLRALGYKFVGDSQTIRNRRRNAAYYILVFASKHERGEEFWNKIARDKPSGQRGLPL
jgi:three-Cys-motif partner protein